MSGFDRRSLEQPTPREFARLERQRRAARSWRAGARAELAQLRAAVADLPTITFLERGTPEWNAAWAGLAAQGFLVPGPGASCPACYQGECWQYMGTAGGFHEFRHRAYPPDGRRTYARVKA